MSPAHTQYTNYGQCPPGRLADGPLFGGWSRPRGQSGLWELGCYYDDDSFYCDLPFSVISDNTELEVVI